MKIDSNAFETIFIPETQEELDLITKLHLLVKERQKFPRQIELREEDCNIILSVGHGL